MATLTFELGVYDLPERNQLAVRKIEEYANSRAAIGAGIGLLGLLPLPGAAPVSIMTALSVQIPLYQNLAMELSRVYQAPYDDVIRAIQRNGVLLDTAVTVAADFLMAEFGTDFLSEIAPQLLSEMGLGFAAAFIPILGGFFAPSFDVAVAATMTWRVGTMISTYYQNGDRWIQSRYDTYQRIKPLTGSLSPTIKGRVDLNVVGNLTEVADYQATQIARFVDALLHIAPNLTDKQLMDVLILERNFPGKMAKQAILLARQKRRAKE